MPGGCRMEVLDVTTGVPPRIGTITAVWQDGSPPYPVTGWPGSTDGRSCPSGGVRRESIARRRTVRTSESASTPRRHRGCVSLWRHDRRELGRPSRPDAHRDSGPDHRPGWMKPVGNTLPGRPLRGSAGKDLLLAGLVVDVHGGAGCIHQGVKEGGNVHRDPHAAMRDRLQRHVDVAVDRSL